MVHRIGTVSSIFRRFFEGRVEETLIVTDHDLDIGEFRL